MKLKKKRKKKIVNLKKTVKKVKVPPLYSFSLCLENDTDGQKHLIISFILILIMS